MNRRKPKAITCPVCQSAYSRVVDTGDPTERLRKLADWSGDGLWRLRECRKCGVRFNTEEHVVSVYPA